MEKWLQENYKNWLCYLAIAGILKGLSIIVESDFIDKFLEENLILLLPALLAINVTTISILLTKIGELKKKFSRVSFKEPILAMKNSVTEQIVLIIGATIALVLKKGITPNWLTSEHGQNVLSVVIIMFAIAAMQIVLDTANALFTFLNTEDEISND